MKKRILAFLMCVCLLSGSLPAPTNAANTEQSTDHSSDVGKYAQFHESYGQTEYFNVLDTEPAVGWDPMQFTPEDFSEDILFEIKAYKVLTDTFDVYDETTGEVTGQMSQVTLWYQVDVIGGTATDFENGYWIMQNYLNEEDAYACDVLTLFAPETTECTCGTETEEHAEDCPLYEEPVSDTEAAYNNLMSAESLVEFETLLNALDEDMLAEVKASDYWTALQTNHYELVYSHFYSTGTEAEFNAVKEKYPDAWNYIQADETLKHYNDKHLERIRYVAENPVIQLELSEVRIPIVYPSYTNAAPMTAFAASTTETYGLLRSSAAFGLARNSSTSLASDSDGNGVALGKTVIKNDDGTYTIRLEAYTTGTKVTTTTTQELPADIILVLDLSKSMEDSMDNVGYQAITSGTAQQLYQTYGSTESLYVQVGEEYREVTITPVGNGTITTGYSPYTDSYKYKDLYEYIHDDNGVLYYEDGGEYYLVSASRTGPKDNRSYTFSYTKDGTTVNFVNNAKGGDTELSSTAHTLYTQSSVTAYDSYNFSYTGADGQTVTINYAPTASVIGGTNPTYYALVANGTIAKNEALVNAVTAFSNQVATKAAGTDGTLGTDDDVAHSIAIVGFSGDDKANTGVYIGSTIDTYSDGVATTTYQNALQNMSTTAGQANVSASIGALTNQRGTYTHVGVEMANGILANQPTDRYVDANGKTIRTKVVVVFTDGEPNDYETPITNAYTTKNTYGATVYTVGILDDGDASLPVTTSTKKLNRFMHGMSSNYQYATGSDYSALGNLTNTDYATDGSYYMLASNANDLNNIFASISSSATSGGSKTTLSETTEVRDIISPYFKLPDGADEDDIKLYTADYTAANTWGEETAFTSGNVTINGKTVSVTGFDYAENWVGTETAADGTVTYRGKKLIIEFPIVVEDDFIGGNEVVTNDPGSGIYEPPTSDTAIETFPVPDTDEEVDTLDPIEGFTPAAGVEAADMHIYITNSVYLPDVIVSLDDRIDGINNAYADIKYEICDANGNVLGYIEIRAGESLTALQASGQLVWTETSTGSLTKTIGQLDVDYQVKVTTTPIYNGTYEATEATEKVRIHAYAPVLTYKDSAIDPGITADYETQNYVSIDWIHAYDQTGETSHTDPSVNMTGTEPSLTITYSPAEGTFTSETEVNVTVKIGDTDITEYVRFVRQDCSCCGHTASDHMGTEAACEFIVHMAKVELTIKKSGAEDIDENQSFIFEVTGPDGYSQTVVIRGNDEVTIKDLRAGTYTVTEKTEWSWRYTLDTVSAETDTDETVDIANKNVTFDLTSAGETVTFTNKRSIIYWLGGDNWAVNTFKDAIDQLFGKDVSEEESN